MRAACALVAAKIPSRKIVDALDRIRKALPPGSSLNPVSVVPDDDATERDSSSPSGSLAEQQLLPLTVDHRPSSVTALRRRAAIERRRAAAEEHFATALALEDSDITSARASYIAALEAHGDHLESRINLGRLLHVNGELAEAEKIYREAKQASGLLSYNLAILLEDLNREEEAILSYREALALDPSLHEAHFNLSRLHEKYSRPHDALRHLLAYRRQTSRNEDE